MNCSNVTMRQGDRLYLPFGTIHRAVPEKGFPSVHITFEFHADGCVDAHEVTSLAHVPSLV